MNTRTKQKHMISFKISLYCFFIAIFSLNTQAYEKVYGELSASLGFANISYSEDEGSELSGMPNILAPAEGTVSSIVANFHYKFDPSYHSSWYAAATVPFLVSSENAYFSLGGGYEYYFSKVGSRSMVKDGTTKVKLSPKFHYFVGGELNAAYLVYVTDEAQKNDTLFELAGTGGAVYAWKKKWSFRGQLSISKGFGVNTSSLGIKAFIGGTYYLED